MSPDPIRRIFISSTAEDLEDHRARVIESVLRLGQQPVAMEFFGARPGAPVSECRALAAGADAVVVIVAHRLGWVPLPHEGGDGKRSITWLEVDAAVGATKPVFAFLVDPRYPWPHGKEQDGLLDAGDDAAALAVFRRVASLRELCQCLSEWTRSTFRGPEDLADRVTGSVSKWIFGQSAPADGLQVAELSYRHCYLAPTGDYELHATYVVENRGEHETGHLLPDSTSFFVPQDLGLAGVVTLDYDTPSGCRHRVHGSPHFEAPEWAPMPDGKPFSPLQRQPSMASPNAYPHPSGGL